VDWGISGQYVTRLLAEFLYLNRFAEIEELQPAYAATFTTTTIIASSSNSMPEPGAVLNSGIELIASNRPTSAG